MELRTMAPDRRLPLLERSQLLASGTTDRQIQWRVRNKDWTQLRAGIYVETSALASLDRESAKRHAYDVEAARRRLEGEPFASHESSARLLGLDLLRPAGGVRMTRAADDEKHVQRYRDLLVYSAQIPGEHVHEASPWGIPILNPARTVIDLARTTTVRQAVAAADSALRRDLVTPDALAEMLDWAKQWPGTKNAATVVELADGRRENPFESESFVSFHELRLPIPEPQVTIGDDSGARAIVDAYWREHHTVGEADGYGKYQDRADKVAERRRHEWLNDLGLEVVRWTPLDLTPKRLRALERRILAAFERAHRRWGD